MRTCGGGCSLTFPLDHVSEDMELQLRVRDNDIRHFESFMGQVGACLRVCM